MVFTRRWLVAAGAALATYFGPMPKGNGTLADKFPKPDKPEPNAKAPPQKPILNPACPTVYPVGVTRAGHDVKAGGAVFQMCKGKMGPIGMAMTESAQGEPVMVMMGFIPADVQATERPI
jgi:hypothetical protein